MDNQCIYITAPELAQGHGSIERSCLQADSGDEQRAEKAGLPDDSRQAPKSVP